MVNYIVKQSIDLRLKFDEPPRITASNEIAVLCGMLCKLYNIPLPEVNTTGELKQYVLSNIAQMDDKSDRLISLLQRCQKESEPMKEEWYEVMKYGYESM